MPPIQIHKSNELLIIVSGKILILTPDVIPDKDKT